MKPHRNTRAVQFVFTGGSDPYTPSHQAQHPLHSLALMQMEGYQTLRELPITVDSTWGTRWIAAGCTVNIWKYHRAIASAIPYFYQCAIFINFNKFCFLSHFLSLCQLDVKKKKKPRMFQRLAMKNQRKIKTGTELFSTAELMEKLKCFFVLEVTDKLSIQSTQMASPNIHMCVCVYIYFILYFLFICI